VPSDAYTARTLGTDRSGNGVLIRDDGLVLTIGYLVTEAETVWMTTATEAWFPPIRGGSTRPPDSDGPGLGANSICHRSNWAIRA